MKALMSTRSLRLYASAAVLLFLAGVSGLIGGASAGQPDVEPRGTGLLDAGDRMRFAAAVNWVNGTQHMPKTVGFEEPDCVHVSTSVIDIDVASATWAVARATYGSERLNRDPSLLNQVGDSLRRVDEARRTQHLPYKQPELATLGSRAGCDHVLFFSEPFGDTIIAEVLRKKSDDPSPAHADLAAQQTGFVYLFALSESHIDTAYVDFVNYD